MPINETTLPTTHTPGPWTVAELGYTQDGREHIVAGSIEPNICEMVSSLSPEQVKANATLIAAAPAMYHALQAVVAYHDSKFPENRAEMMRIVEAAMKQARP